MGIFSPDFPQSFLQVILFLVVWGGGVLPINFGNFGPKPPRPKETIGSGVFLFSKIPCGALWGKSGLKTLHFPQGLLLGWPPNKFGEFWAPATQAKGNHWESSGENLGQKPSSFPMVTFGLGGLGGRLLPMDFGNFRPKGGPENSKGEVAKFWVVWRGVLPINFGNVGPQATQAKGNHKENGGFQPRFFPRALPRDLGEKKGNFYFLSKIPCAELWEKFGWRPPIFHVVFLWPGLPINFGNFGVTIGKIEGFQAGIFSLSKIPWGELWGKSGL